ncbi:hypothetical protein D0T25_22405 [Duganella sp. BJB488]|uniref:hypothetical protein n=1 Tax=unclassified Duganella TaxID=2636909 RepID=UPI000E34BEC3|nr:MULTISPECIES: hypothetical protein [unclassified Duganella]RFP14083.1 hypothetical protein D0T26_22170 [Duganella sp. BJB489]RFP17333.1 hypothetical protein D0T25_22405 [Duganella sp. BJB488]RFP31877.1 hypothetical protein D0T24_23510 [Duganella sp. BJB480]
MDEQITQLDRRLTSVEKEVTVLAAETASMLPRYATKEDLAKLDARVAIIQSNYATKEDLAALDHKLSARIGVAEIKLSGDIAALDCKQSADIASLRLQLAELELRLVRWLIATVITTSGVVVAAVKLWP